MSHKSKKSKNRKNRRLPVMAAQPATAVPGQVAPAKPTPIKSITTPAGAAVIPASVKYATLPAELKRVGLFTAAVLILLIVLWVAFR
jgi:hypothetical protein